jgi:glycosyl transferase, family 25
VLCINLERRPDRWAQMQSRFQAQGIQGVERYPAKDGTELAIPLGWRYSAGAYGCLRSHESVVAGARQRRDDSILIFEDDAILHPDFAENFIHAFAKVPQDWDALYFGGIHEADPIPVAPGVSRLSSTNSTYALALRNTLYDVFLERTCHALIPVDEITRELQTQFRFYCFMPHLAWVDQDQSDILGAEVNHWWLEHSLVMNGRESKQALERAAVLLRTTRANGAAASAKVLEYAVRYYSGMGLPVHRWNVAGDWPVALEEALHMAGGEKDYLVVADYDVLVPHWEFRASLLKCLDHDRVLPLYDPLALSREDTERMLTDREDEVDTRVYPRAQTAARETSFAIYATAALRRGNGAPLRTFESPSRLLRLYSAA